jgi:DNA-binding NarL/FixJ family response regulator
MPIRVSIVEDDRVTRESLSALISRSPEHHCVGAYATAEIALQEVPKSLPEVLVVDINLPGKSGIECVAALTAVHRELQVLMLTTYDDTENIFDSLRAGASGYLLKRAPASELLEAITEVSHGGSPMSSHIARKVVSHFHRPPKVAAEMQTLTAREGEILSHLAQGLQYKEIADRLGISASTVRAHLHTIYGKLHVQSRTEAVVKYLGQ